MEYSIKIKNADGSSSISMGNIYYDKFIDQLIYTNKFPDISTWIIKDTIVYRIKNRQIIDKQKNISLNTLSIFSLAMNGHLSDFGLAEAKFSIKEVVKQNNKVITTWLPPQKYSAIIGKVLVRNIGNRLDAIIIEDKNAKIISKQFFRNYEIFNGLAFPTELVQVTYDAKENENYQLTNFRNIKINDFKENFLYFFPIGN